MNTALALQWPISDYFVERVGWVLVHSLWQFSIIGLFAAALMWWMRRSSSDARYGVLVGLKVLSIVALAVTAMLPATTGPSSAKSVADQLSPVADAATYQHAATTNSHEVPIVEISTGPTTVPGSDSVAATNGPGPTLAANEPVDAPRHSNWTERIAATLQPWLVWIVGFWGLGVVACSLRPLFGWLTLVRLRRVGVSDVSKDVLASFTRMSEQLGLRRSVRLLRSTVARAPSVIGYWRPVILVPVGLMTSMPAAQLEAILLHELAHIRRHDFIVNLLQVLLETLLFYHPVVWWLSHRIRVEREHCCDDLVVRVMNNRTEYGRALIALEELSGRDSLLALGASHGSLIARIRRLAGQPSERDGGSACIGFCLVICVITSVLATSFPSNHAANAMDDETSIQLQWGEPVDGLHLRAVPVHADMNEEVVDMNAVQRKFESQKQVAFAIEVENVSDKPIKLLDTAYGDSFGNSSGKANTNWYSQFLFTIEYFDADGKKVEYPHVEHVMPDLILGSAKISQVEPGELHRFLIRPQQWRSIHYQRLIHRKYTAVVHYHGMSQRAADRIRVHKPDDESLETWSGDVASTAASFQIARPKLSRTRLNWGEPDNGLRAATSFAEMLPWNGHGQKLDLLLHVQNVSEKPITLASEMWLSTAALTITDSKGNPVKHGNTVDRGGITPMCRTTLQPQQTIVLNAGNLGVAKTQDQANAFDYLTHGAIVVPTGEYRMSLSMDSRLTPRSQDGQGNPLAPLDGDYVGKLTTGRKYLFLKDKPFDIEAEQVDNASTPRQWAEIYVNYVSDQRNADGTYRSSVFDPLRKSLQEDLNRSKAAKREIEPGAQAWLAAVEAKDTWTHEELLAHVLELSQWSFHVVGTAHYQAVENSKYPRDVPRPGRKPTSAELARLPFGEAAENGLRVAWVFESEDSARIGQTIGGRMVFHNSGDQPVSFSVEPWGWTTWKIRNQHGNQVGPRHIPLAFWLGSYVRFRLQPGQIAETIGEPIGFGELSDVDHSLATTWIPAKPGEVLTISGQVRLGQAKDKNGKPINDEFTKPLPIKERTFAITAAVANAADAATVWAGYFVDQLDYRRNEDGSYPSSAFNSLKKYLRAYEVKGRHVNEWIAKADSKRTWPRDEFEAHVKDIATWSISTVHHAHAQEQRAVMNIPQLGRKPEQGELQGLPFGAAAPNGLRVAWVFKPTTPSYTRRLGDVLNSKIVFHNSGDEPVTFSTLQWPDASWELRDKVGNNVEVSRILTASLNFDWQRFRLLPGHVTTIDGQPIGLGKQKGYGPVLAKIWFPGNVGQTIKVSGKIPLDAARPVDGGIFESDWRAPLTLTEQTITLTASDSTQPAPAAVAPATNSANTNEDEN